MIHKIDQIFIPKNFLIIGDIMLDIFEYGKVEKISSEAPVPVFTSESEGHTLGGAGNVANNLRAAGQNVHLISLIGNDIEGDKLLNIAGNKKIIPIFLTAAGIKTTVKKRLITERNQHVLRVDYENKELNPSQFDAKLLELLEDNIQNMDAIIVADFNKGFLSETSLNNIVKTAKENKIPLFIDSKKKNQYCLSNSFLIKTSRKKFKENFNFSIQQLDVQAFNFINETRKRIGAENLLITLGSDGILLSNDEKTSLHPTKVREIYDVSGAGNTVLSWTANAFTHGFSLEESIDVANYSAGVVVSKPGTSVVYPYELKEAIEPKDHKIFSLPDLKERTTALKSEGKKIVFTTGCFDILDKAFVHYLQKASEMGDYFVIGLNSDDSVRKIKGNDRPFNREEDRALVLSSLYFTDAVLLFEENDPVKIVEAILPDILVKGSDCQNENSLCYELVLKNGGRIETIPLLEEKTNSATNRND